MSAQKMIGDAADPEGKGLYRAGGLSGLLLAIGYVVIIPLYADAGAQPTGGEARLQYLAGKTTVWWAILALSVLTDLLFLPVAFALYSALKGVNRNAMPQPPATLSVLLTSELPITRLPCLDPAWKPSTASPSSPSGYS